VDPRASPILLASSAGAKKRVDIKYDGTEYSIGNRHIDEVQAEIDAGLTASHSTWLTVNFGEGRIQIARLLITPGVSFSLIGIDDPDSDVEVEETG
jgi:hypothetical protein